MNDSERDRTEIVTVRSRKREIELLRLLCTIAVCMHHLRYCSEDLPYGGGYLAVDFFFIISGFYLRKSYMNKVKNADTGIMKYIKNRYIRLFKDYFVAFVMALLVNVFLFRLDVISNLWLYIKEAFMVEIGCIESGARMNPPDWYCGYLFLSSIIVWVIQKYIHNKIRMLSLVAAIILYVIMAISIGHLCIFPLDSCVISLALIRALAGQLIGVFLAESMENKRIIEIPKSSKKVLFGGLILIVSYFLFWDMAFSLTDYLCVFLFIVLIYVGQTVEFGFLSLMNEKIWNALPDLLYAIFLNHYIVVKVFAYYNVLQYADWKMISILYIVVVFAFSFVILQLRVKLERVINISYRGIINERQDIS